MYALYQKDKRVWAVLVFYLVAEFSTATWLYTSTNGHRAYNPACANFASIADTYPPSLESLGLEVPDELHNVDSLRSKMSSIPSGSHLC